MKINLFIFILLVLLVEACGKKDVVDNPYEKLPKENTNNTGTTPDPNSFLGLHTNIFKPTCANSGCHDGTFEPDFRTVESAYNSLVYAGIVKNTANADYTYRVLPADAEKSMLFYRITENLGGNSGVMPLRVDPGNDYEAKRAEYIQNIKNWINGGAKDQFGNAPIIANTEPQIIGVIAYANGSNTPLSRPSQLEPILVPAGTTQVEVYICFIDDKTPTKSYTVNDYTTSTNIDSFENKPRKAFSVLNTPKNAPAVNGVNVPYYHKITLSQADIKSGKFMFIRSYMQDQDHTQPKEIPATGSPYYIKYYSALQFL